MPPLFCSPARFSNANAWLIVDFIPQIRIHKSLFMIPRVILAIQSARLRPGLGMTLS